jgi:hypothetical protein
MPRAEITRKFDGSWDAKVFDDATPFESLKVGDIVKLKYSGGVVEEHVVTETHWEFSNFGVAQHILHIVVEPKLKKKVVAPPAKPGISITGSYLLPSISNMGTQSNDTLPQDPKTKMTDEELMDIFTKLTNLPKHALDKIE